MTVSELWIEQYLAYHEDLRELDRKLEDALRELEEIKKELDEAKARKL